MRGESNRLNLVDRTGLYDSVSGRIFEHLSRRNLHLVLHERTALGCPEGGKRIQSGEMV